MSDTQVGALGLKRAGDSLYYALPLLQKRIVGEQGARDLSVEVIVGDVHDQTVFTEKSVPEPMMRLTVCLHYPDGVGDVASSTFRACTYALYSILRERMRHVSVRQGTRRLLPPNIELEASMPLSGGELTMELAIFG